MAQFKFDFTVDMLKDALPKMKDHDEWFEAMAKVLPQYDIDTPERVAMFLAQCSHESMNFNTLEENLKYSKSALNRVFRKYFGSKRDASEYAYKPEKIANVVYSNRMGNGDEASGDGWRYRGRGVIQLTGKSNYSKFAKSIGATLDQAIDYLSTKMGALEGACWFWEENNINRYADTNDVRGSTKRINGGYNGLKDRENYYNHISSVFGVDTSSKAKIKRLYKYGDRGPIVKKIQQIVGQKQDGIFGMDTMRGVERYQRRNGLKADGIVGEKTLNVMGI